MIAPTWDLFLLLFFLLVITYSFIIGRDQTVKVTIATYISIFVADGLGNVMQKYFFGENPVLLNDAINGGENSWMMITKIIVMVLFLILLMLKGNFVADIHDGDSSVVSFFITSFMGLLSSALIICAMLVFVNNGSFIEATPYMQTDLSQSIYDNSLFARILIDNINLWFILPAIAFIIGSITNE